MKRDGLLFGSGWYIDADEFTQDAGDRRRGQVPGAGTGPERWPTSPVRAAPLRAWKRPSTTTTPPRPWTVRWFAFIGGPDGKIVGHSDITKIGGDTQDLFGSETLDVTEAGSWVESESLRLFVAGYDGYVFGSGWSRDE